MARKSRNAILELTYGCNFACPFCYAPWHDHPEIKHNELSTVEWERIIKSVEADGASAVTLTGGEPLSRDDCIELIGYVREETKIPRCVVYTNLGLADARFYAAIDDGRFEVDTSLQGIETLSEMSGCQRSLSQFESACRRVSETKAGLSIGITITKVNMRETEALLRYADTLGPLVIQIGALMIEGRAKEHPELWMTYEEIVSVHERIEACRSMLKANLVVVNELYCSCRTDAVKPLGMPQDFVQEDCVAGQEYVVFGPDGCRRKCMHTFK